MPKTKGRGFLVTGGAGFIGSILVERLLGRGARVVVYDNLSSGRAEFVKPFEKNKGFSFVKADLLDREALDAAIKDNDIDAVMHLAANPDVRRGSVETDLDLKQGTLATYNLLECARLNDVKELAFSSSSVVYGYAAVKPTPEEYGPLRPVSLYGASKLAAEGLITAFSHLFGMSYYIFRFANIVGRNSTHGIILDLLDKLDKTNGRSVEVLGDGKQNKSYMDVQDCADAMIFVYENSKDRENVFNLATDGRTSGREIADMVVGRAAKGARIDYTGTAQGWPGDVPDTFISNGRLKALGFKYRLESTDAVRNAVEIAVRAHIKGGAQP